MPATIGGRLRRRSLSTGHGISIDQGGTGAGSADDAHALSRAPSQHRRRGLWAMVSPIAGACRNNLTGMGRQSGNPGLQRLHTYDTNISGSRIRDEEGTSSYSQNFTPHTAPASPQLQVVKTQGILWKRGILMTSWKKGNGRYEMQEIG